MKRKLPIILTITILIFTSLLAYSEKAQGQNGQASIYLSPASGTFEVGSTFDVSFFVSTGGQDINAVQLDIIFPADRIQLVEPSTGNSFISLWIEQPKYSNTNGTASFQGGLPSPGINTSAGLITTITFRVEAPGPAIISVNNTSRVLANDGNGTDLLTSFGQGSYNLTTAPPEGPVILSSTHGNQNKWYRDNNILFSWKLKNSILSESGIETDSEGNPISASYSWEFNDDPQFIPDNNSDGEENTTAYQDVESGIWYFHVKGNINEVWGKTSHYTVKIDTQPPATFTPEIEAGSKGKDATRFISYMTSDQHSGIEYYKVKIESLTDPSVGSALFIEETSPWQLEPLPVGEYKVIVRAFDRAGNFTDGELTFKVSPSFFEMLTKYGISFGAFILPWWICILLLIVILILLIWIRRKLNNRTDHLSSYLTSVRKKAKKKRKKLAEEITEEAEIEKILAKGLDAIQNNPQHMNKKYVSQTPNHNSNQQKQQPPKIPQPQAT